MAGKGTPGLATANLMSPESIASVHTFNDSRAWSLWQGGEMVTCCDNEAENERVDKLNECVKMLHAQGVNGAYLFKFHDFEDMGSGVNDKTPYKGSLRFRLHETAYASTVGSVQQPVTLTDLMAKQLHDRMELDSLMQQYAEANGYVRPEDQEEDEEEEDDSDPVTKVMGRIGATGERYPWMQEHIRDGMTMAKHFFKKITGIDVSVNAQQQYTNDTMHNATVGNVPPKSDPNYKVDKISDDIVARMIPALSVLLKHDANIEADLILMAKLAQADQDVFDLALKKLRNAAE